MTILTTISKMLGIMQFIWWNSSRLYE